MRAAVIGLGPHGRRLAQAIGRVAGLELAAVVDKRDEALAWSELPAGVARLRDVAELWAARPDLVCIATNGPSHATLATTAFEAGVGRVMVEKPMGCSVEECRQIIAAAEAAGARLAVNQSRRHDPLYLWLRERIRSGEWGQLRAVWIQRPGIGLGCLGTHYFDLVRMLAEREVRRVTAWVDPFLGPNPRGADFEDPGGLVVIELDGNVRGVIAQIEDGAGPMSVELDLTRARVRIDEQLDGIEIIERDASVKPGPGRPAAFAVRPRPEGLSAKTDVTKMATGVIAELAGEGPMECDARHGLASIEVLVAAHLSHRRGNVPVAVPLAEAEDRRTWLPVT